MSFFPTRPCLQLRRRSKNEDWKIFNDLLFLSSKDGEEGERKFNCDGSRLKRFHYTGPIILFKWCKRIGASDCNYFSLFYFAIVFMLSLKVNQESSRLNANMETLFASEKETSDNAQRRAEIFVGVVISRCIAGTIMWELIN